MCSENLRLDTITVIKQRQMKMLLFKFMEFSKNNKNSLFIYRSITNTWSNIFASLFRKTMRTKYYEMFHSLSLYRCRVQKAKKIKQNKKICGRISTTVRVNSNNLSGLSLIRVLFLQTYYGVIQIYTIVMYVFLAV